MFLLGYDIGSSSVKASLVDAQTQEVIAVTQSPQVEMPIHAPQPGFAEQDPNTWWQHVVIATQKLFETGAYNPQYVVLQYYGFDS